MCRYERGREIGLRSHEIEVTVSRKDRKKQTKFFTTCVKSKQKNGLHTIENNGISLRNGVLKPCAC